MTEEECWSIQSEGDQISLAGEERLNDLDGFHQESAWLAHSMTAEVTSAATSLGETPLKANTQSELQLRYLLQLFTEADCLDWALILALILRDAMAVLRLVSMARSALNNSQLASQAATIEVVTRLRDGLLALSHWAETDCQGYRQFMNVIYGQVGILTKLILPNNGLMNNGPPSTNAMEATGNPPEPPITTLISGTKSRHTSVTLLTPLGRVTEEDSSDNSVFQVNGKMDLVSAIDSVSLHNSSQPLDLSTKRDQLSDQQPHQEEPVQSGSNCVIS